MQGMDPGYAAYAAYPAQQPGGAAYAAYAPQTLPATSAGSAYGSYAAASGPSAAAVAAAAQQQQGYVSWGAQGSGSWTGPSAAAGSASTVPAAQGSAAYYQAGASAPAADARSPVAGGGIPYDAGAMPQEYQQGYYAQGQQPPMTWGNTEPPEPVRTRIRVRLPKPRFHGGPQFYGCVPKDGSTFAWPELCATPDNELSGMAPVPGVQKTWYNTVFYYPEEHSHVERQFLERFVQGPNGEWLDVVKARRMSTYLEEKREEEMKERMERQMLVSGSGMEKTGYTDAYSGEPLVACRGELASKEAILEEHGIHRSSAELAKVMMRDVRGQSDFDNLRIYWPFATPHRNKMVSQHTYDWFDRNHNPYLPSDDCVEIYELNSMYVDKEHYEKNLAGHLMDRRQELQEAYQSGAKFVHM